MDADDGGKREKNKKERYAPPLFPSLFLFICWALCAFAVFVDEGTCVPPSEKQRGRVSG